MADERLRLIECGDGRLSLEIVSAVYEADRAPTRIQRQHPDLSRSSIVGMIEPPVAQVVGTAFEVDLRVDQLEPLHDDVLARQAAPREREADLLCNHQRPLVGPRRVFDAQPAKAHGRLQLGAQADAQVVEIQMALRACEHVVLQQGAQPGGFVQREPQAAHACHTGHDEPWPEKPSAGTHADGLRLVKEEIRDDQHESRHAEDPRNQILAHG